jgi:hypothetical protein
MRAITPGYPFRPRGKERGGLTLARPAPVCIGTTRPLPPPASSRPAGGVLILLDQDGKIIRQAPDRKFDSWGFGLALLWHSYHRSQSEAGAAEWTSQAHGVCEMIKQHAPDRRQCRVRWRSAGLSFFPLWRPANADAAGTGKRSMSSAYAGAGPATSGPRSDRARVLP